MPLQIPHPTTPRHLYRHLLREATYLLPLCRHWVTERIRNSFRQTKKTKEAHKVQVRQAHGYLRYLRAANCGDLQRVLNLCFLATGRKGKRRHELHLALGATPEVNTDELIKREMERAAQGNKARKPDWLDDWNVDMVKALSTSQKQKQDKNWPSVVTKNIDPMKTIPTHNVYGRKTPHMRIKLKRHWANVIEGLQAPLPQGEWENLRELASIKHGEPEATITPRRPVALPVATSSLPIDNDNRLGWNWKQHVTTPIRVLERGNSRKFRILHGGQDSDPRGPSSPVGAAVLTARRLRRRIYDRIWQTSPLMILKEDKGWSIQWGGRPDNEVSLPTPSDLQFFKGISREESFYQSKKPKKRVRYKARPAT